MNARVRVLTSSSDDIAAAAQLLRTGGVVAFPTETVYGLGANALDAHAVARIFEAKQRPQFDPLIVHVASREQFETVAAHASDVAQRLMDAFWPGPLTLVLPKTHHVPDLVTSGLKTVAVRMPEHPVARALLAACDVPVAAPSANPFGYISPTTAAHVIEALDGRIDAVIDGGATTRGIESTIVALDPRPALLRLGTIPVEAIEHITGPLERRLGSSGMPVAPGQLQQHYSPHTPVRIVRFDDVAPAERAGASALAFAHAPEGYRFVRVLSPSGDAIEAAAHVFAALHELDASGASRIDVELLGVAGIGEAVDDRLRRAAAR